MVTAAGPGPGRKAGIQRGDVIQMINNAPVDNMKTFRKLVNDIPPGKTVAVLIFRHTGPMFLALKVPDK